MIQSMLATRMTNLDICCSLKYCISRIFLLFVVFSLFACGGGGNAILEEIDNPIPVEPEIPEPEIPEPEIPVEACLSPVGSQTPIRRITETEYDNAVQALLGVSMHDTTNLVADSESGPFATNRGTPASLATVQNYLESAEQVSSAAVSQLGLRDNWILDSSIGQESLMNAIDSDTRTRWTTEANQKSDEWLTIDLGAVQNINQIVLDHERGSDDFPVSYEVFVSNDGVNWGDPVAAGDGTASNTIISFDTVDARHIRMLQLGTTDRNWWSIYELNVLPAKASTTSGIVFCDSFECADSELESFARLAYRRSLSSDELETLRNTLRSGENVTDGVQLLIERVLQSPQFLYQVEQSVTGSGPVTKERLAGFSVAEKLASFLWNSIPDDELLDAAESGGLDTEEGVQAQAERMMNDPQASSAFVHIIEQWFDTDGITGVQKDAEVYPEFNDNLTAAMKQETANFVKWMIDNNQFTYNELLTSSKAFPGDVLAGFYNVTPQSDGVPVDLDERVGILTHPSVTAAHASFTDTSVVGRGDFILSALLCIDLPDPPAEVEALIADIDTNLSIRDRLAQHNQDPSCAGCHDLIDPLGFALESYGATGAVRTEDNLGFGVETFGVLRGTDQDGEFSDIHGLMDKVIASETGLNCSVEQWFRFSQRRLLNANDNCSVDKLALEFKNSDYDFNQLIRAIVISDAFLFRDSSNTPAGEI